MQKATLIVKIAIRPLIDASIISAIYVLTPTRDRLHALSADRALEECMYRAIFSVFHVFLLQSDRSMTIP